MTVLDAAQVLAGFARGEQDVERLGRGDEDVRRVAEHGGALFGQRVAGADSGADLGGEIAAFEGELLDLAQGLIEILLHVVRERLERRDVDDLRCRRESCLRWRRGGAGRCRRGRQRAFCRIRSALR